jgi:hypothetical protein
MANIVTFCVLGFFLNCLKISCKFYKKNPYVFHNITSCYDMVAADVNDFNLYAANVHMATQCNVNFCVNVRN